MIKSAILALPSHADSRLIFAEDEGKFYSIAPGSAGSAALAVGSTGPSNYERAVAIGAFTGTEAEFIESLRADAGDASLAAFSARMVPLFIFNGESNSAGRALNSAATSGELAARSCVQILNNVSLEFEDLDIGTNNILRWAPGTTVSNPASASAVTDRHGWELELANRVAAGDFLNDTVYLIKTGQGGSKISQWDEEGYYWVNFLARYSAARLALEAENLIALPYVFYSQGINDTASPATNPATWAAATVAHFEKIRALVGFAPIIMTRFSTDITGAAALNSAMEDIAKALPLVYLIDSAGADRTIDGSDIYHWSYAGMKDVAGKLIDCCIDTVGEKQQYVLTNFLRRNLVTAPTELVAAIIELVSNGKFTGGTLTSWTNTGTTVVPYEVANASDTYGYKSADGNYPGGIAVFNGGSFGNGGIISQDITTEVGKSYTLKYRVGALFSGGTSTQTLRAQVMNGSTSILNVTDTVSYPGSAQAIWAEKTLTFTATSTTTTLKFTDESSAGTSNVDLTLGMVSCYETP